MDPFAPLAWYDRLASKLFVPLAIKLCHLFRITQYQLHDYLWMLFYWTMFYLSVQRHYGWFAMTVFGLIALRWTVKVGLQHYTTPDMLDEWPRLQTFQRRVLLLCESYHTGAHVLFALGILGGDWAPHTTFDVGYPMLWYALIAEYAVTIRNLPPREEKEPARQLARQKI
jgi:hypothetical protein